MSEVQEKAILAVPRLGAYWDSQGGIYAGVMPGEAGQPHYHLIVSIDEAVDVEWGGYGKKIPECDSRLDGAANTRALLGAPSNHPAAEWADGYTRDGHSDFYLPAQRELNLCYATVAEKFAPEWYWSSTQYDAGWAWYQFFYDGYQSYGHEGSALRARAVRRLIIQ